MSKLEELKAILENDSHQFIHMMLGVEEFKSYNEGDTSELGDMEELEHDEYLNDVDMGYGISVVVKFLDFDNLIVKFNGYYQSYHGEEFTGYEFVQAKQKTITYYE